MRELRKVSGEEAIRSLQRLGFEKLRQRGSHVVLKKQTKDCRSTMPARLVKTNSEECNRPK
jgi:predicted RNA binding protein YcfA (HicA-like mRNA interferase family)